MKQNECIVQKIEEQKKKKCLNRKAFGEWKANVKFGQRKNRYYR